MPTLGPQPIPIPDQSLTINQFCAVEKISRAQLYKEWRANRGPRFFLVGNFRRIAAEARAEWRRQREAEATQTCAA